MSISRRTFASLAVVLCLALPASFTHAQDGGGGGGGGGRWDPAQMRERMMQNLREQMAPSEEEWQVLQPKLEKLMTAQREARGSMMGFGGRGRGGQGGGGGGGGGGQQQPTTALGKAQQDLRTTLDNKDAAEGDIASKLKAFRDARAKAQEDLKAAQEDVRGVLSTRQEAVLVSSGILE